MAAWLLAEAARVIITSFGGSTELGGGAIDMLSRKAGYTIAKADQLLGYRPQISLEEGMRLTEEWATEAGLV